MTDIVYDNIVVMGAERTRWEPGTRPKEEKQEIIQVNVCLLNISSLRTYSQSSFLVKPQVSTISEYCFEQTGITQEMVENAKTLTEVREIIENKFDTPNHVMASYTNEARRLLTDQSFIIPRHINVQTMFSIIFNTKRDCLLDEAIKIAGLKYEGDPLSPMSKVYNTSRVLAEVIRGGMTHK